MARSRGTRIRSRVSLYHPRVTPREARKAIARLHLQLINIVKADQEQEVRGDIGADSARRERHLSISGILSICAGSSVGNQAWIAASRQGSRLTRRAEHPAPGAEQVHHLAERPGAAYPGDGPPGCSPRRRTSRRASSAWAIPSEKAQLATWVRRRARAMASREGSTPMAGPANVTASAITR